MNKASRPTMSLDQLACKILLTPREACAYAGLGMHTMGGLLKHHPELVLYVGNRRMVRRAELETCLSGITALPGSAEEAVIQ